MRVLLTPEDERKKSAEVQATSDENGVARFEHVKRGRYYVEAVRLGVEVGPGTVIVSDHGSSEQIAVQWPLRPAYTVITVAGRFQRHLFHQDNPIDGFVHPQVGPLAGAKLTLSGVDSERQVGVVVTDSDGNFDFRSVEPGAYLLHIEENPSRGFAYPIDDYLLVYVDPVSVRGDLRLQVDWTSCGITTADIQ
jgi:Prealbumin-like fold domain